MGVYAVAFAENFINNDKAKRTARTFVYTKLICNCRGKNRVGEFRFFTTTQAVAVAVINSAYDPTTKGLGDSARALTYTEPKEDESNG